MSDFVEKWCNPDYFDSLANPAEEMENDLKAAIAQAVKDERERIRDKVRAVHPPNSNLGPDYRDCGTVLIEVLTALEADHE